MTAKIRLRQHTNPLSYRGPYRGPPPREILGGPVDELEIGPGLGELLVARAQERPDRRVLGLEVRQAYVEICNQALDRAGVRNARAIHAEVKWDLPTLIPDDSLRRIYFMFPDPWFKKRHHKRRVMTPSFAPLLARKLRPGGELLWASDNRELAYQISLVLCGCHAFVQTGDSPPEAWLCGRGQHHSKRGDVIYGGQYVRRP